MGKILNGKCLIRTRKIVLISLMMNRTRKKTVYALTANFLLPPLMLRQILYTLTLYRKRLFRENAALGFVGVLIINPRIEDLDRVLSLPKIFCFCVY